MNGPIYQRAMAATAGEVALVDFEAILGPIWRAKILLVVTALLAGAAAFALATRIEPTYRATAQAMLDPRQNVALNEESLIPELTLNASVMASEVSVLRSNLVLERVATELDLAARPEFNGALSEPSIAERAWAWITDRLGMNAEVPAAADEETTEAMRSAAILRELQQRLDIQQNGVSYVISISARSQDPELASALANSTANAFLAQQIDERVAATDQATGWLDQRVQDLRAQVETAEASIAQFRSNNLVLEGSTQEAASQQVLELSTQVSEARARHAAATARYDQAGALSEARDLDAVARIADSPLIVSLREQRVEMQRAVRQLSELYEPNDQRLVRARGDLADLDAQILAEAKSYIDGLRNAAEVSAVELSNLEENLLELEGSILDLSKSSVQLRQQEREADAIRGVYESLLSRLKETRAIEEMNVADAKVVSRADVPALPSSPNIPLLAGLGALTGLGIATALVISRNLLRRRFRSRGELEASTGLPVLAELPHLRGRLGRCLGGLFSDPHSAFAERVRDLRSTLELHSGREASKVVMLTSALPGEGKSTVAVALAQIACLGGQKVIVVDGDLRRPSLGQIAAPSPRGDLASVLLNDTPYREAIVHCEAGGFDVLPTAATNARAADTLLRPAFARLIQGLRSEYDLVLIDTPPVLAIADARSIAAQADTILLVLRLDRTVAAAVAQALANLAHGRRSDLYAASPRVAGFVLTMQKGSRQRDLTSTYAAVVPAT